MLTLLHFEVYGVYLLEAVQTGMNGADMYFWYTMITVNSHFGFHSHLTKML
jgi:hypothetical protein